MLCIHNTRQSLCVFGDCVDIDHRGNIGTAMADKDPDTKLFIFSETLLRRQLFNFYETAPLSS